MTPKTAVKPMKTLPMIMAQKSSYSHIQTLEAKGFARASAREKRSIAPCIEANCTDKLNITSPSQSILREGDPIIPPHLPEIGPRLIPD